MYKVHMHAGAIRQLLYGCAYVAKARGLSSRTYAQTINHKTYKPAISVGPPSAHERNAMLMAFRWRIDDGPLIVVIVSSLP